MNPHSVNQFFDQVLKDARGGGTLELRALIELFAKNADGCDRDPQRLLAWRFAQFIVGSVGANRATTQYELNEAGNWLCWSLADSIENSRVQIWNVGRVEAFLDPMITGWSHFSELYTGWMSDFYYYARQRALQPEIAEAMLPVARRTIERRWKGPITEQLAVAASNLLSWSAQASPDTARHVARLVKKSACDHAVDGSARLVLAMTLSTATGKALGEDAREWRKLALRDLGKWHRGHHRLQLLIDELGDCDDQQLFDELLQEISSYQGWVSEHDKNDVDVLRGVDALAPLITTAVHICLDRGQGQRVVDLLARWYGIESGEAFPARDLLIQCPFSVHGYLALIGSTLLRVEGDRRDLLVALTQSGNEFLGVFQTVVGSAVTPHLAGRQGVVDESAGVKFEARLADAYLPAKLGDRMHNFAGQIIVPSKGHPLQAIQLRNGAACAPVVASLRRARPDRAVRRVVLWSAARSMTEELEQGAVAATFRNQGVQVHIVTADEASADRFLAIYQDESNDVLWVMSHGSFDHYTPKHAGVVVDQHGGEIGISELRRFAPQGACRRLLVLNVCDGGRFEEIGVLPRVGIAPAATSSGQATISHLWPVHGLSAAIFGTLLAGQLVSQDSFFSAFTQAMRCLGEGRAGLADRLRASAGDASGDIISRLERSNVDLSNIAHWGSPVFYA